MEAEGNRLWQKRAKNIRNYINEKPDSIINEIRETLLPALRPGDIAVMDNMRTLRMKAAGELLP